MLQATGTSIISVAETRVQQNAEAEKEQILKETTKEENSRDNNKGSNIKAEFILPTTNSR